MRHFPILRVVTMLVILSLVACNPANPPHSAAEVTLGFASTESLRSAYEPLIATFNAENPDVQVRFIGFEDIEPDNSAEASTPEQQLRPIASAADTLDLSFFDPTRVGGCLLDLAPLMDADPGFAREDFYPRAFAANQDDAAVTVLPHTLVLLLLAYNQELWAAHDLPPPDPAWTWRDLTAAATELAAKQGDAVEVYGLLPGRLATDVLVAELEAQGSDLFSTPPAQARLDTPAVAAALDRVVALGESGAIYLPAGWRLSDAELQNLILDRRVGMWPSEQFRFRSITPLCRPVRGRLTGALRWEITSTRRSTPCWRALRSRKRWPMRKPRSMPGSPL